MPRDYAPSEIIRNLLIGLELGSAITPWPVWIALSQTTPDEAIIVYDTAGMKDGRLLRTGEVITHPGVQIRVRGKTYPLAWAKANAIAKQLAAVQRTIIDMATDVAYVLVNASQQGDMQPIGFIQEGDRATHQFTINYILTIELFGDGSLYTPINSSGFYVVPEQ